MGKREGLTKEQSQQLQVRCPRELYARLLAMTEGRERSITYLVNEAIESAVGDFESQKKAGPKKKTRAA